MPFSFSNPSLQMHARSTQEAFGSHMTCPQLSARGNQIEVHVCQDRIVLSFFLETFMAVGQKTGAGSNPCISRVVSKPDRDHGTTTMAIKPLG